MFILSTNRHGLQVLSRNVAAHVCQTWRNFPRGPLYLGDAELRAIINAFTTLICATQGVLLAALLYIICYQLHRSALLLMKTNGLPLHMRHQDSTGRRASEAGE